MTLYWMMPFQIPNRFKKQNKLKWDVKESRNFYNKTNTAIK